MADKRTIGLGDALEAYLRRAGLKTPLDRASAVLDWPDIVGPQIAHVTVPEGVTQDGILFVRVTTAAWMQELQLMSPDILRKLGERGKKIRRIVWNARGSPAG